jgi:hypothetical protein
MMKNLALCLIMSASLLGQGLNPLGGLVSDPRLKHPELCRENPEVAADLLMAKVDHTPDMPPVGAQTGNSCTGWSVGYYFKTHQERVERGWDLSDPGHRMSPMFLYNQINGGVDGGADLFDALELMWAHGCAPSSQMGTNVSYTLWPSETAFDSALLYRCVQAGTPWFQLGSASGIEYAKQLLSENRCLAFNISVFSNFDNIKNFDTVYCAADSYGTNRGGHNLCMVGYDDDKATRDGTGAFRCVNSWGTGWGHGGYWWMSYQVAQSHPRMVFPWAGYAPDTLGYQPVLKARVRVSHGRRGHITFRAGVGSPSSPLWSKVFYSTSQYWYKGGNLPFPATNLVLDLSEGAPFLDSLGPNNIFVGCIDDSSDAMKGNIEYFSVEHLNWNTSAVSDDTPVEIPDYDAYAYAQVTLEGPAGVAGGPETLLPSTGRVLDVRPNPSHGPCWISFSPGTGSRCLGIYDAGGRLLRRLTVAGGTGGVLWDAKDGKAKDVPAGVYLVRVESDNAALTGRLVIVR